MPCLGHAKKDIPRSFAGKANACPTSSLQANRLSPTQRETYIFPKILCQGESSPTFSEPAEIVMTSLETKAVNAVRPNK